MSHDPDLLAPPTAPEVGHPVRSFVAVLLLAALALLALQWSGAVWPALSVGQRGPDPMGLPAGHLGERIDIHNDGAFPVRVRSVDWPSVGLDGAVVERIGHPAPGTIDFAQRHPATDFEIPAGGSITLVLSGRAACVAGVGNPRLHVDVRLGPDRTVELDGVLGDPALIDLAAC